MNPVDTKLHVLVVDDEPFIRRSILRMLREVATVAEAGSVQEAMAVLQGAPVDLLICDVHLPDGLGWQVLAAARATNNKALPALMMSGQSLFAGAAEHGAVLVQKPFEKAEMLAAVQAARINMVAQQAD